MAIEKQLSSQFSRFTAKQDARFEKLVTRAVNGSHQETDLARLAKYAHRHGEQDTFFRVQGKAISATTSTSQRLRAQATSVARAAALAKLKPDTHAMQAISREARSGMATALADGSPNTNVFGWWVPTFGDGRELPGMTNKEAHAQSRKWAAWTPTDDVWKANTKLAGATMDGHFSSILTSAGGAQDATSQRVTALANEGLQAHSFQAKQLKLKEIAALSSPYCSLFNRLVSHFQIVAKLHSDSDLCLST